MKKEQNVMTALGLCPVTNLTENHGYKVLGFCKLWNPNPLKIEQIDLETIKNSLPKWLDEKYSEENLKNEILKLNSYELNEKLKYIYTIFWAGENDVYVLKVEKKEKVFKIYFLRDCDPENRLTIKNQEWMSMLDDKDDKLSPEQIKYNPPKNENEYFNEIEESKSILTSNSMIYFLILIIIAIVAYIFLYKMEI